MFFDIEGSSVRLGGTMHWVPKGRPLAHWVHDAISWARLIYLEHDEQESKRGRYAPAGSQPLAQRLPRSCSTARTARYRRTRRYSRQRRDVQMRQPPSARPPERRFHLSRQEGPRERGRRIFLPSHQVASCRVLWRRVDRRIRVRPPQCFGPNRSLPVINHTLFINSCLS